MRVTTTRLSIAMLATVLWIVRVPFMEAQSFKKVSVKGNAKMLQVVAGGASVWALATNGQPYLLSGRHFVLANTIALSQISAGGGSLSQADAVWALDASGNIYRAAKSGKIWSFAPVAGSLTLVAVGPGYEDNCHAYEVWGLNSGSEIFRYDFCGLKWDQIPGTLCDLAVGGAGIWGSTCDGSVYRFDMQQLQFEAINNHFPLSSISVGPDDVYALDGNGDPNAFNLNGQFFSGLGPFKAKLKSIRAGGNGAWMIGGAILRSDLLGQRVVKVDGPVLSSISVGTGAGVWGIDGNGQVFAFSTP